MVKCNKEYKIFKLTRGTTKSGQNYTSLKIKEAVKDASTPNGWKQYYYKVYVGFDCADAVEGGTISWGKLDGVAMREYEYNGKGGTEVTIYPDRDTVVFKDPEGNGGTVNANPWGNEDLPF